MSVWAHQPLIQLLTIDKVCGADGTVQFFLRIVSTCNNNQEFSSVELLILIFHCDKFSHVILLSLIATSVQGNEFAQGILVRLGSSITDSTAQDPRVLRYLPGVWIKTFFLVAVFQGKCPTITVTMEWGGQLFGIFFRKITHLTSNGTNFCRELHYCLIFG